MRDWIHVDDHSRAVWEILMRRRLGKTYLIGADCARSNIDVLRMILAAMDKDSGDFDWVSDWLGHDRRYAVHASKLRCELGWRPVHTDFEAGLRETIAWYVKNWDWWESAKGTVFYK